MFCLARSLTARYSLSKQRKSFFFFFFFKCPFSIQTILSCRIFFGFGRVRDHQHSAVFGVACPHSVPIMTDRSARGVPLWIVFPWKKCLSSLHLKRTESMQLSFVLELKITSGQILPESAGDVFKYPYPQWWHQKKIRLEQNNRLLILRSREAAFFAKCGIIFQVGSFLPNLSFPFHQDNHCFTVVPLNRSWKRMRREECLLAGMIVLRHNVIIRTHFCRTFGENHFARSLTVCWAVRQLLGDSPPGEQLWSTLWGLNYSFRMATCIQLAWDCGEDFASCSSALLDGLSAHPASSHFMKRRLFTKVQTLCRQDLVIKKRT